MLDGVGTPALTAVVLGDCDGPTRTITLSIDSYHRNDVRALHGLTVGEEKGAVSPPQVKSVTVTVTPRGRAAVGSVTIAFEVVRGPDAQRDYATAVVDAPHTNTLRRRSPRPRASVIAT